LTFKKKKEKAMTHEIEVLTEEEQHKFVNYFYRGTTTAAQSIQQARNRLLILLMLDAGLRVGETIKLHVSDLHFAGSPVGTIIVSKDITKTHTSRSIPVTIRLRDAISEMFLSVWHKIENFTHVHAFRDNVNGSILSIRQVQRIVETASINSIGRPIHPHVLRHTFATRLLHKCDIRTVQQLLGHSALSSTQIYTHVNTQDLQKAIDALNP
jgi:site-specific recombinase XerD